MAGIWDDVNTSIFNPEKPNDPGVISDVRRALGQTAAGFGSTLRDLGLEETGGDLERYGTGVVRRNPSEIKSFEDVLSRPLTTAREAVGEVVPQVGLAVGGQLIGRTVGGLLGAPLGPLGIIAGQQVGGLVGGLAPIAAQTYGGIRSEQRAAGIDDRPRALGATIPAAALERFGGAERIAGKIAGEGTKFLARESGEALWKAMGKQAIRGGLEETITEIPQTALERYGAYNSLTDAEAIDEYGVAGAKAFLGGGAIRAGLSSVAGTRQSDGEFDLTQPDTSTTQQATTGTLTGLDRASLLGNPYAAANPLGGAYANSSLVSPAILNQETDLTTPAAPAAPVAGTTAPVTETKPAVASIFSPLDEELNGLGIKPTKKARGIYEYMVSKGIDPASPEAEPVLNALAQNKPNEARTAVAEIIRARSPRGAGIPSVSQPAGGLGGGALSFRESWELQDHLLLLQEGMYSPPEPLEPLFNKLALFQSSPANRLPL